MFVVANRRNAGCGRITFDWSSSVSLPDDFEHALNDEHHIGAAGVVLVEHKGGIGLQRERQDALAELCHLLAVLEHDRVLADEIDAADVAVEVDADAGPVEASGDLLDVSRLAGAVVALDHHAAVVLEAGQDRESNVPIEQIIRIEIRHMLIWPWNRPEPRDHCRSRTLAGRTASCREARATWASACEYALI